MRFLLKSNKKYFLAFLISGIFFISENATSEVKTRPKSLIKIQGKAEPVNVTDIPLPEFDYDFDSFSAGFHPGKELINLLDRPEALTGMGEKEFAQDFPIEQ